MITTLTKEQEASLIPFREKWRTIGLSTERADRESSKKAITALYTRLGKKEPLFIFCPSPLFCIQQINFFKFSDDYKKEITQKDNLGSNLWSNVRNNLESNLENRLRNNLWRNLGGRLWNNLGRNLGRNLRNNLENNLGNNLESNLRNNLRSNHENGDKFIKELSKYHEFYGYGQMDSAWIAFYQFMETIGIKYDDKDSELLEFWAKIAKSCSWFWTFENVVFVSDRPTKLNFMDDGSWRLHSEIGPAYEYTDGWCGYYLQGINLSRDLWEKTVRKTLPAKEALKIENQDQKTVVMQYLGGQKILEEVGGKKFSEDEYGELWRLEEKDTNGNFYIYYVAPDPSKNNAPVYLRTHPDMKTPQEAMTRAYKLSRWGMAYQPSLRT